MERLLQRGRRLETHSRDIERSHLRDKGDKMLEKLREQVCRANLELVRRGVVIYTWGNVSGVDRDKGLMVIKPSGVDYDGMKPEDMVVIDLMTGETIEGKYRPSSDTATHLELYRAFFYWWYHSHTFHQRSGFRTSRHGYSSTWHYSCRLLLWPCPALGSYRKEKLKKPMR